VVVRSYVQSPRRERVRKKKRDRRGRVWSGRREEVKSDRLDFGSRAYTAKRTGICEYCVSFSGHT
jgi:hypothetical protein